MVACYSVVVWIEKNFQSCDLSPIPLGSAVTFMYRWTTCVSTVIFFLCAVLYLDFIVVPHEERTICLLFMIYLLFIG